MFKSPSTQSPDILLSQTNPPQSLPIDLENQVTTCPVCLDQYPSQQIHIVQSCKHSFCSECLKEYLLCQINANKVLNIPCPQSDCPEILQDQAIKAVLLANDYNRYVDLVLKKIAVRNPEEKYCPNAGCSRLFTPSQGQEFTICQCGTKICNTCNQTFHTGKSCIEALDVEFEEYARNNQIRFCIMCKSMIIRDGGCSEMKCAVCDYEFCWLCGRELDNSHNCTGKWNPIPPSIVREGPSAAQKYSGPRTGSLFFGLFEGERNGRRGYVPGAETMVKIKEKWERSSFGKKLALVVFSPLILIWYMIAFPTFRELGDGEIKKNLCLIIVNGVLFLPFTALAFLITGLFDLVLLLFWCVRITPKVRPGEVDPNNRWLSRNAQNFVYKEPVPHGEVE